MNEYPESIYNYPLPWLDLLGKTSPDELFAIDRKQIPSSITNSSFADFMLLANKLSVLPDSPEFPEIPLEDWAFNGVKNKKRHEIQKIVPRLKKIKETNNFDYIVDIGGGVGHLSRVLSHYHSIASISLDRDPLFQKIGEQRLHKYRKIEGSRDVKFVNLNFGDQDSDKQLKEIFKPQAFSLGLHTCGSLANILIQKSIDFKTIGLMSFGCCYHRMNPETDLLLSNFYQTNQFPRLNLFALSLATRSHSGMSRQEYNTKERVKYYRYALHLFLMKHFNNKYLTGVGECHIKTYWEPFSNYISDKLLELKLVHQFTESDFNLFYDDPNTQKELRTMWLCNIIRWQLGRCLEVYLLLDRCLYLEEQGYDVLIEQYFNESLSPRNIGILAILKK